MSFNRDYRFDIQLREGVAAESWFYEMTCGGDKFEVKHDHRALETGRVYVEVEHDPGRSGVYRPSGINTTESHCWIFVLGESAPLAFIGLSTDRLRELAGQSVRFAEQRFGSCPTRGALIPLTVLIGGAYFAEVAA